MGKLKDVTAAVVVAAAAVAGRAVLAGLSTFSLGTRSALYACAEHSRNKVANDLHHVFHAMYVSETPTVPSVAVKLVVLKLREFAWCM